MTFSGFDGPSCVMVGSASAACGDSDSEEDTARWLQCRGALEHYELLCEKRSREGEVLRLSENSSLPKRRRKKR